MNTSCVGASEKAFQRYITPSTGTHIKTRVFAETVSNTPPLLTPSKMRSLRVSFEVPVVDGFNQLLGHLDNLLLTSWGEIQTQSYRGRQSGKWQLIGILPLPSCHFSSFLWPKDMMLHCCFTLICLQCTPVSTRKLNTSRSIYFLITLLIIFPSLKDLLSKKQNKPNPNSKFQTQGSWLLFHSQSGCSSSLVQATVVIPRHTPTHGFDH